MDVPVLTLGEKSIVAGVCAGLAEYYSLSRHGLRAAFLVTAVLCGLPILVYLILWMILPRYPTSQAMRRHLRRQAERRRQ